VKVEKPERAEQRGGATDPAGATVEAQEGATRAWRRSCRFLPQRSVGDPRSRNCWSCALSSINALSSTQDPAIDRQLPRSGHGDQIRCAPDVHWQQQVNTRPDELPCALMFLGQRSRRHWHFFAWGGVGGNFFFLLFRGPVHSLIYHGVCVEGIWLATGE